MTIRGFDFAKDLGLTEEPTGRLRLAVPKGTTTEPPVLQQEWAVPDPNKVFGSIIVWRDVPIVVAEDERK